MKTLQNFNKKDQDMNDTVLFDRDGSPTRTPKIDNLQKAAIEYPPKITT